MDDNEFPFSSALDRIREEFPEQRACLVLDKQVRRYVVSWSPALLRMVSRYPMGSSLQDLWDCVHVDLTAVMDITGDPEPVARAMLRRLQSLQSLQLIYPDGSVPDAAIKPLMSRLSEVRCL